MLRYFKILGLSPDATALEIKRAYRKKAMQYHPDRNRASDARHHFLEVLEAYEYLTGAANSNVKRPENTPEQEFEDLMREVAQKKAKEKYRQRVREFRKRQAEEQSKEFIRAIYVLVAILVMVGAWYLTLCLRNYIIIVENPKENYATVVSVSPRRIDFMYANGEEVYRDHAYVWKSNDEMLSGSGMPIVRGDQFVIRFNAEQPEYFQLQYHHPSPRTMQRYLGLTIYKLMVLNEDKWAYLGFEDRKIIAMNMARETFKEFGIEGMSNIYFAETFFLENIQNNSFTWFLFKNSTKFKELSELCEQRMRH